MIPNGLFLGMRLRMASGIISERSFEFAVRIVKLCERMWKGSLASRKIADQLFDSGTSIGANSAESQGGQTKPDFIAKLSVSRKESWETIFWLQLAIASDIRQERRGCLGARRGATAQSHDHSGGQDWSKLRLARRVMNHLP